MATITITKKEYLELIDKKLRFDYLRNVLTEDFFAPPPTKDSNEIIRAFKAAKKYNQKFINGLKRGLDRSAYFK